MLVAAGLVYVRITGDRSVSAGSRVLEPKSTNVTVVVPPDSGSGVMRGRRWQIVPGGFGGFSAGAGTNSEAF
jgi:hypothetical protein